MNWIKSWHLPELPKKDFFQLAESANTISCSRLLEQKTRDNIGSENTVFGIDYKPDAARFLKVT